jgi:hypothetical protein
MEVKVKSNSCKKNIGCNILLMLFLIWFLFTILTVTPNQYAKYTYEDITVSRVDKTSIFHLLSRQLKGKGGARSYYTFSIDSIGNVGTIEVYGNDGVILLAIDKKSKDIYLIKQLDDALLTQVGDTPSRVHTNGNAIKSQFKQHKLYWRETETMECYILCAPAYRTFERKLNEEYYPTSQIKPNYIWEDWGNRLYRYFLDWLLSHY